MAQLTALARDSWKLLCSRPGFIGFLLAAIPINHGAIAPLFAKLADGWHVSPDTVVLVNGTLSGALSILGCLVGGWLSDRLNRKGAYAGSCAFMAAIPLLMTFLPRTGTVYAVIVAL